MSRISFWLLFLGAFFLVGCYPNGGSQQVPPAKADTQNREVFFCFWNVENFFDNQADRHSFEADKEYDQWFASNPKDFQIKVKHLVDVLLKMNEGKGPDILALAEVEEGSRAPEILAQALNSQLGNGEKYSHIGFKNPHGGRAIATCLISKIPIKQNQVTLLGRRLRILVVPVQSGGKELLIVASHWTSRVSDKEGTSRKKYASQIHGEYIAMARTNPAIDFLVCGDFNSNPEEEEVAKSLQAYPSADRTLEKAIQLQNKTRQSTDWLEFPLFNPFAKLRQAGKGTLYYHNKPDVFDQILVSPGMLDNQGWSYVQGSAAIYNQSPPADAKGHPRRFGSEKDKAASRGYSDHFPVTAILKINP